MVPPTSAQSISKICVAPLIKAQIGGEIGSNDGGFTVKPTLSLEVVVNPIQGAS